MTDRGSHHTRLRTAEPQSGSIPMTHYQTTAFDTTPSIRDTSDAFVRCHTL